MNLEEIKQQLEERQRQLDLDVEAYGRVKAMLGEQKKPAKEYPTEWIGKRTPKKRRANGATRKVREFIASRGDVEFTVKEVYELMQLTVPDIGYDQIIGAFLAMKRRGDIEIIGVREREPNQRGGPASVYRKKRPAVQPSEPQTEASNGVAN